MKGNEDLARSVMPVSSDLSGFSREHMVANPELLVIVSRAFIVACVGMAVYIWKRKRSGLKLDSRWRLVGPLGLFTLVVSLDTHTVHNDEPKVQLTLISVGLALGIRPRGRARDFDPYSARPVRANIPVVFAKRPLLLA